MSDLLSNALGASVSAEESSTDTVETIDEVSAVTEHFANKNTQDQVQTDEPQEGAADTPVAEETVSEDDEELTDEEKQLKELKEYAANPNTPAFARTKIEQALKYNESLKEQYATKEMSYQEELSTLKSNRAYEESDLKRYKMADETVSKLSSLAIVERPDEAIDIIRDINPRLVPQVQQKLIWDALVDERGNPDYTNLQVVFDQMVTGVDGARVDVKDAVRAIQALAAGRIDPLDFDEYYSDEQRESAQRARQYEREAQERQARLNEELSLQEERVRNDALGSEVNNWVGRVREVTQTHMDKFHLAPSPNDPAEAKEFKELFNRQLTLTISEAEAKSPHFKEISQAIQLLSKPNKMSSQEAQKEIRQFFSNPHVQSKVEAGLADVTKAIEKQIMTAARHYKLLMKGLESSSREKVSNARPIPRTTNAPKPQNLTAEDVAKMSAQERRDATLAAMSDSLRQAKLTTGSFG